MLIFSQLGNLFGNFNVVGHCTVKCLSKAKTHRRAFVFFALKEVEDCANITSTIKTNGYLNLYAFFGSSYSCG